jgi:tellurite resistance protein
LVRDLTDPIAAPFASLAVITPMLLAAEGLYPHAPGAGRVLLDVFLTLTVLLGAWFTGQWIYRPVELDNFHPGYFLPTVAGGLIASAGAAEVGQRRLAELMLGLGAVCWLVLGSIILGRLLFRPLLPSTTTAPWNLGVCAGSGSVWPGLADGVASLTRLWYAGTGGVARSGWPRADGSR